MSYQHWPLPGFWGFPQKLGAFESFVHVVPPSLLRNRPSKLVEHAAGLVGQLVASAIATSNSPGAPEEAGGPTANVMRPSPGPMPSVVKGVQVAPLSVDL